MLSGSPYIPVHVGSVSGVGQGVSALAALQEISVVPLSMKPLLQPNVATLPRWFPLLLVTTPFSGALALSPVHFVGVQLPPCVSPFQVIIPL